MAQDSSLDSSLDSQAAAGDASSSEGVPPSWTALRCVRVQDLDAAAGRLATTRRPASGR